MFVHIIRISCYVVGCSLVSTIVQANGFLQAKLHDEFFCFAITCYFHLKHSKLMDPQKLPCRPLVGNRGPTKW